MSLQQLHTGQIFNIEEKIWYILNMHNVCIIISTLICPLTQRVAFQTLVNETILFIFFISSNKKLENNFLDNTLRIFFQILTLCFIITKEVIFYFLKEYVCFVIINIGLLKLDINYWVNSFERQRILPF